MGFHIEFPIASHTTPASPLFLLFPQIISYRVSLRFFIFVSNISNENRKVPLNFYHALKKKKQEKRETENIE